MSMTVKVEPGSMKFCTECEQLIENTEVQVFASDHGMVARLHKGCADKLGSTLIHAARQNPDGSLRAGR